MGTIDRIDNVTDAISTNAALLAMAGADLLAIVGLPIPADVVRTVAYRIAWDDASRFGLYEHRERCSVDATNIVRFLMMGE